MKFYGGKTKTIIIINIFTLLKLQYWHLRL